MLTTESKPRRDSEAGYVLDVALRVILLLAIVGMIIFLASRYRTRVDVTADQLYTLTDSTEQVLGSLENRLLIEAYFSPDEKLPQIYREYRRDLRNFLDEYVQKGNSKVLVRYYDPQEDDSIREKAQRLGMQGIQMQAVGDSSLEVTQVWQGVRIMYGADKQKTIPFMRFAPTTSYYETELTPIIKDLTVLQKPKVGLLAFATEAGGGNPMMQRQRSQPKGFDRLLRSSLVTDRYELENVDLSEGKLVPEDIGTMFLIRPKRLTDRQKYAIDQFVMRGGKLVVCCDTAEYDLSPNPGGMRSMSKREVSYDDPESKHKFVAMLDHYGIKTDDRLVGDGLTDVTSPFLVMVQSFMGQVAQQVPYPYWIAPSGKIDYTSPQVVDLAANTAGTSADGLEDLKDSFRKSFKPGLAESPLFGERAQGPVLFWPCPVDLKEELPEGVTGETLMRTSPFAFAQLAPSGVSPLGFDPRQWQQAVQDFTSAYRQKVRSSVGSQFGLMVKLEGTFSSFFEGKDIPPRKKPEPEKTTNPLDDPIGSDPLGGGAPKKEGDGGPGAQGAGEPTPAKQGGEPKSGEEPKSGDATQGGDAKADEGSDAPEGAESQGPEGPPAPPTPEAEEEKDPDPIFKSQPTVIYAIGDSDFLRDDLTSGEHRPAPVSQGGERFFASLLDVLKGDTSLQALRNKQPEQRVIEYIENNVDRSREETVELVESRQFVVQWANVLLPPIVLLAIWLLVSVRRRAVKKSFLASVEV